MASLSRLKTGAHLATAFSMFPTLVATRWDTIWVIILYVKLYHLAYFAAEVYCLSHAPYPLLSCT